MLSLQTNWRISSVKLMILLTQSSKKRLPNLVSLFFLHPSFLSSSARRPRRKLSLLLRNTIWLPFLLHLMIVSATPLLIKFNHSLLNMDLIQSLRKSLLSLKERQKNLLLKSSRISQRLLNLLSFPSLIMTP